MIHRIMETNAAITPRLRETCALARPLPIGPIPFPGPRFNAARAICFFLFIVARFRAEPPAARSGDPRNEAVSDEIGAVGGLAGDDVNKRPGTVRIPRDTGRPRRHARTYAPRSSKFPFPHETRQLPRAAV